MQFVDHIFVLLLLVVQPIYGAWSYKRYLKLITAGMHLNRARLYQQTILLQWVAFVVVAGTWTLLDRPVGDLGLTGFTAMHIWGGAIILALATAYLLYARQAVRKMTPDKKSALVKSLGTLVHFLPQNHHDYKYFVGVSITAGIVEESLYRGFMFWYLSHLMPIWGVVLVSSIIFGLGHTYQGTSGVIKVSVVGIALGALYVFTGSIWLPMIAHTALDIVQGAGVLQLLQNDKNPTVEDQAG